MVVPPRERMTPNPSTPSSSTPESNTPMAWGPKANATDRNNALIAGRCPFPVGPCDSSTR